MRKYTGRTLGGGQATVECPDWCVVEHEYWDDTVDDMFHRSAELSIEPPRAPAQRGPWPLVPHLATHLVMHSTDPRPCAANIVVALDEHSGRDVELGLTGVDELLVRVDAYRAGLKELRGRLAAVHRERRRVA